LCGATVFALGQASVADWGVLTPAALCWLVVSLLAGCAALLAPPRLRLPPRTEVLVLGILLMIQAAQVVVTVPVRPLDTTDTGFFRLATLASSTAFLGAVWGVARGGGRALFALAIAAWFAAQLWVLVHSVGVPIDVYHFQRDAVAGLLSGENPYRVRIPNLYGEAQNVYGPGLVKDGRLTYGCPYPPLSLLLVAPAQLLGDLRYCHLLATALVAVAVGVLHRSTHAWLALGLYLFTPLGFCLNALAYTEVLVVALLALTVLVPGSRPTLVAASFGLLLAVKQTLVFAPPLLLLLVPGDLRGRSLARFAAVTCAVAAAVTLPIALWDPVEFWRSIVVFQFVQPFRFGCLSFLAALADVIGREPPRALILIPFALAGLATWVAYRRLRPAPASFSLALGVVLLLFFLFNKQAFPNYYLLVSGALCLAVIAGPDGSTSTPPPASTQ
jgi:hypothetical protein